MSVFSVRRVFRILLQGVKHVNFNNNNYKTKLSIFHSFPYLCEITIRKSWSPDRNVKFGFSFYCYPDDIAIAIDYFVFIFCYCFCYRYYICALHTLSLAFDWMGCCLWYTSWCGNGKVCFAFALSFGPHRCYYK